VSKGNAIPAKFDPPEEKLLRDLKRRTGLSVSEIIRRSVRLLGIEIGRRGSDWIDFLIQDLSGHRDEAEYHAEKKTKRLSG
jgi:Ribbon-helix-helix protein, copG family